MERNKTPRRMVENGRVVEYGAFLSPFEEANMSEARIKVSGRTMPGFYSRFRLKEWQHIGIIGDDFYFGFAIVNAKYLGNSFCYFLDRTTGAMVEHDRLAPPGVARVARDIWRGECGFRFAGYEIGIQNRLADSRHVAEVDIKGKRDKPAIRARVEVIEDLEKVEPLELISMLRGERPAYTHKVPCPVRGEVTVGDRTYSFTEDEGIALIDVQKTFFPYTSYWNWATCASHDENGRIVALNLSQGINIREDEFNDGVLWVDGTMSRLGPARFELDADAVLEPWHIETTSRSCVLDFEPVGQRWGKVNALVIMSDFHQPYGTFRGTALDSEGRSHEIDEHFGVVEHHLARY